MSDNLLQTDSGLVATDELSTLNGTSVSSASPRIQMQRVKPAFGADGDASDVSLTNGLPIQRASTTVTGTITVADTGFGSPTNTTGTSLTTTPTTGSVVGIGLSGDENTVVALLSSIISGTYYAEFSPDATTDYNGTWFACYGRQLGVGNEVDIQSLTTASASIWNVQGGKRFRLRNFIGTFSSTSTTVNLYAKTSLNQVAIRGPLGSGLATLGTVNLGSPSPNNGFSGSITAQNSNPLTGAATFGSSVYIGPLASVAQISIEVLGTVTSPLSLQLSSGSGTWVTSTLATAIRNSATGATSATITAPGVYEFNTGGASYARVSALSAWASGTASIAVSANQATDLVSLTANRVTLAPFTVSGTISAVNANLTSGVPTANSTVALTGLGDATQLSITVQTAFVGTLQVQIGDNTTWESNTSATGITKTVTGAQSATITGPGTYEFNTGGCPNARVTCSAYTSGGPTVTVSASNAVALVAVDQPLPAGTNSIGNLGTVTTVSTVSNLAAIAAGANLIADVGIGVRATTNSLTKTRVTSAASTNANSIKASAGRIYAIALYNTTASVKYLKLYNKATAPTVGTDTPVFTLPIPANGWLPDPTPILGDYFATGIALAITGALADSDTTATAAGDVVGQLLTA